jgi:hypothetical protein
LADYRSSPTGIHSLMDEREEPAPEDSPEEPGAEGGSGSEAADRPPAAPAGDDESPVGDTDQHSDA